MENNLKELYDICNEIFKDDDLFYTDEELEKERNKNNKVFIKGEEKC